jgi:hypothetical protein
MAYTEQQVGQHILALKTAGMSLRQIAKNYKSRYILHTDIERILLGKFPKGEQKRSSLGLPPICPTCYRYLPKPPRVIPDWLKQATENLAALEKSAPARVRLYGRGGKPVKP